jgi:PST family polysaccharide transporter
MSVGPDPDATVEVVGRFTARGGIRRAVARGTIINTVFLVGVTIIGFLKGFLVASFLSVEDYGFWGIIAISVSTLSWLLSSGFGQKFIEQDEEDQLVAFQKAFTLELMFGFGSLLLMCLVAPLLMLAYGHMELLPAALVFALYFPSSAFTTPLWVFYREMKFTQQRLLEGLSPIIGFVLTIGLAIAGAGYWSLVIGAVVGVWSTAIAAVIVSPYPLRLRYDKKTMREYISFSWPLLLYGGSGLIIAQVSLLVGTWQLGVAAVGAIALTATITQLTDRLDQIVTGTLYPAICAVKDQTEVLFETFIKSNRLALMWGVPFGAGVALFAGDIVHFVLGDKWQLAIGLLQAFGLIAAANQIGFNWDAFYRARNNTKPMAIVSGLQVAVFLAVTVPAMTKWGLDGFAAGMATMTVAGLAGRTFFLRRLFPGFRMWRYLARAIAPTVPAVAVVLALRLVDGHRSLALAIGEVVVYGVVTLAATVVLERKLIDEIRGYLRHGRPVATVS